MKRLVLFVEGQGDVAAVPSLVGRLCQELPADLQGQLFIDDKPFRIGGVSGVTGRHEPEWVRYLKLAHLTRKNLGAVLAVFDGDAETVESVAFCAAQVAQQLVERSRAAAAGVHYSLAVVFLRQEYESLLIAAASQLPGFPTDAALPADVETAPWDAKGWLDQTLPGGYSPTSHQLILTQAIKDWAPARGLRSFRRLESALNQLARAIKDGSHVCTPISPPIQTDGAT